MEDRAARALGQTADAGHVVHLVHHHRIGDVGLHACHAGDLVGDQTAEVRGMLHLGVDQVFAQGFVHLVGAGRNGFYQAAAADDGRQLADVEVLLFERLEHDFAAPGQLLGDIGEFRDLLGRMAQGQFEQRTLVFVEGHLGRGGTGVDC